MCIVIYQKLFYDFPSGIMVAHYLQSITPALALGGELVYHRRPGEEGAVTSLLGRYTGKIQYFISGHCTTRLHDVEIRSLLFLYHFKFSAV